jgi:hypothetical protein
MEIEEFHRINRIDEYSLTQRGSEELVNSSRNIQDYYGGRGGGVPTESTIGIKFITLQYGDHIVSFLNLYTSLNIYKGSSILTLFSADKQDLEE